MKKSVANRGRSEEIVVRLLLDLYQRGKQTGAELAARYGVSTRTIYRKLDILSCIVPVIIDVGRNGGIYLMEGFEIRGATV